MTKSMLPTFAHLRRIAILYVISAAIAAIITGLIIAMIYDPQHALFSLGSFLAGVVAGAFTGYASRNGLWHKFGSWAQDVMQHPARMLTP